MNATQLEQALRKLAEESGLSAREAADVLAVLADEFKMVADEGE